MYREEHYLSKIERNANVIDKAPENVRKKCIENIKWARALAKRLELLDYDKREIGIANIHKVMDQDYIAMGFQLKENNSKKR